MSEMLFNTEDYTLAHLLHNIEHGVIGLPDIQRPFVWKPTQVRDLFDSMYRGFPVGHFLFWSNDHIKGGKTIGTEKKQAVPSVLIVDGQLRLTSLYAVLRGKPVLDEQYQPVSLRIAFHPAMGKFAVADAAIANDAAWVPDISSIWASAGGAFVAIKEALARLGEQGVTDKKQTNQIANLTLLEWPENIKISDQPPAKYVPKLRPRFTDADWAEMHRDHALPNDWWEMSYDEFLPVRRKLMAGVIRRAFEAI